MLPPYFDTPKAQRMEAERNEENGYIPLPRFFFFLA